MVLRKLQQLKEFYAAMDIEPVSEWFIYGPKQFKDWVKDSMKQNLNTNKITPSTPSTKVTFRDSISPLQTPGVATQVSSTSSKTLASEFQKSVKKSVDDYQSLTKDSNWKTWKRLLNATAANH